MTLLDFIGYLCAFIVGLSLGLLGGGGSILATPIMVYVFGLSPSLAIVYSRFVVGASALLGSSSFIAERKIDYKTVLVFGIPSIIAMYLTKEFFVPALPDVWLNTKWFLLTKETGLLLAFAILMVASAFSMLRDKKPDGHVLQNEIPRSKMVIFIIAEGTFVGILSGLVGVGGGFLIVPALVILTQLPMKTAVGSSLLIISANSLIGFFHDAYQRPIDWKFLIIFSLIAAIGILSGNLLAKRIPSTRLKKWFGWMVLILGTYIMIKEVLGLK